VGLKSKSGLLTLNGIKKTNEITKRLIADGRYLLSGLPRIGGIASVFRAFDTQGERYVAVKLFRPIVGTDPVVEESFRRETQALSDLKHSNIVQIFDSGFDANTGEHYIAMEWVDEDLTDILSREKYNSWDAFFSKIGRQILEALAFAHSHRVVHRDIKPSNVLVTKEGFVKVCDFGISKIRNFLEPGVTLAHFASFPFAPPELDDGSYSYSRDVFGFAALAITALSENAIENHMALLGCLEQLNIEEPLKRLLRRATSIEHPYERQQNAAVLLAELDRLAPPQVMEKNGRILIGLTTKVKRIFEYDLALKSDAEIQKFVENDLQFSSCVHDPMEPRANPDGTAALGRTIRLLGGRYGYIAVMAHPVGEKLLLVSALEQSSSDAERSRDEAKPSQYEFCFGGVLPNSSNENIVRLQDELLQFGADQKANWIQQRQQAIYKTWLDLLSAKTELERKRKRRFNYVDYETSGGVTHFVLATGADVQFLSDQNIQIEGGKNEIFSGEVVSVNENIVTIKPGQRNQVDVNELPKDGTLVIDTSKADVALDRQRLAVDAVRFGRAVNPTLGDYIVDPSVVPVPAIGEINFIQSSMDDDKRDAVLTALSEPALMLVQGPPGAGKTTFITEVVLQTLRRNPNARILLTSQTHVALDNSLERILKESDEEIRAIRIGNETDDRIAEKAKALLIDRKLPEMRKLALSQGREFIESWAHKSGVNLSNTRMAMALERHAGLRERLERVERQITDIDLTLAKENTSIEVAVRADSEELRSELIREQDALDRDVKEL
jgi:serine/threonine protein kinase